MARIVREIEVNGKILKALFDTGSLRSYILTKFRPKVVHKVEPIHVALGGNELILDRCCYIVARIEGLEFTFSAYLVDNLGETKEGPIDAIIGALCMEEWYIKLDPRTRELDLSHLRRREFTEF